MHAAFRLFVLFAAATATASPALAAQVPYGPHVVYAIIEQVQGDSIVGKDRSGRLVKYDIAVAKNASRTGVLYEGRPVALHGDYDAKHTFHVNAITSANGIRFGAAWPADR
jgi:hypothetical protein